MNVRRTPDDIDAIFRAHRLEPISPYTKMGDEREAICTRCGTLRFVRATNLIKGAGYPCRWCHGWESYSAGARLRRATSESARGAEFVAAQLQIIGAVALTPIGDEFTPVGCLCPNCGETFVTLPSMISAAQPHWYACHRCKVAADRDAKAAAPAVYEAAGMRLLGSLSGENVPQPVECLTCGSRRRVRLREVRDGSAPLCWTCTYGIAPDEPHRVYLFHFAKLGVYKVGITHNRHDRRLFQHIGEGGMLVSSAVVADRYAALAVEAWVLSQMAAWRRPDIGPTDFPQGGFTEAWSDLAPPIDLPRVCEQMAGAAAPR